MPVPSWIRTLQTRVGLAPARRGREKTSPRRRPFRPRLEGLEDRTVPAVQLSVADPAPVPEGGSGTTDMVFTVTRSGDLAPAVSVNYTTQDGTAVAGRDYLPVAGTLTFAPNQATATIAVPVVGNTILQADRTLSVVLSDPLAFSPQSLGGTAAALPGLSQPFSSVLEDFNGDGKPDIAVATIIFNSDQPDVTGVAVFLNNTQAGDAAPSFQPVQEFTTGSNPFSLATGDLNGDGRPDLAVVNRLDFTVTVLVNRTAAGSPVLQLDQQTFAMPSRLLISSQESLAIGDVNGDGKPDFVVANQRSNTISVYLNQMIGLGGAEPWFAPPQNFAIATGAFSVALGDINQDGRLDIVVTGNTVSVLLNATVSAHDPLTFDQHTFAAGGGAAYVALGDVDNDNDLDIAVTNPAANTASVLLNTTAPGATTPSFTEQSLVTGDGVSSFNPEMVALGDINGDGRSDLVVCNEGGTRTPGTTVSVLLNKTAVAGIAVFAPPRTFFTLPTGVLPISVAAGDLSLDGRPDLVVGKLFTAPALAVLTDAAVVLSRGSAAGTIQDDDPPSAGGPYTVSEGQALTLAATASTDPTHAPPTFSWDVNGDGVYGDATGANPTLTWAQLVALGPNDGPHTNGVKVRVSDGIVTADSPLAALTINNAAPTARLTQPGTASGSQVSFTLTATDPSPLDQQSGFSYALDWGDGPPQSPDIQRVAATANNGAGVTLTHAYAADGLYTVSLTATDKDGGTSRAETSLIFIGSSGGDTITLSPGPNAGDIQLTDTARVTGNTTVTTTYGGPGQPPIHPTGPFVVMGGTGNDNFVVSATVPGGLVLDGQGGGGDNYTVKCGSWAGAVTVHDTFGGAATQLVVNGAPGADPNYLVKTPGQITFGTTPTPTVTVHYSTGIKKVTVNGESSTLNSITDPSDGDTTINGGPGTNEILITATAGGGTVVNGGPGANSYTILMGGLAGPVTVNSTAGTSSLTVIAPPGSSTLTLSATQLTGAGETITLNLGTTATGITVDGSAGNTQLVLQGPPPGPITPVNVNFAPTAGVTGPASAILGQPLAFALTANDLDPEDRAAGFIYRIDWDGDGTVDQTLAGPSSLSVTHAYTAVGPFTVRVTAEDQRHAVGAPTTLLVAVHYRFGGFLPPLADGGSYNAGRTLPIKLHLTDYAGNFISRLSAVKSLKVQALDGSGTAFDPTPAGGTGLGYDTTGNQYMFHWDTKGVPAGHYRILLALDDGTTWALDLWLT